VSGTLLLKRADVAAGALWPQRTVLIRTGALRVSTGNSIDRRATWHKRMGHRRVTVVSKGRKYSADGNPWHDVRGAGLFLRVISLSLPVIVRELLITEKPRLRWQ